jgi:hypothetical protein
LLAKPWLSANECTDPLVGDDTNVRNSADPRCRAVRCDRRPAGVPRCPPGRLQRPGLYRDPLSATGASFARCDGHWAERLREQQRINETYPDSPVPPSWFDPADAGEQWNDDY